MKFPDFLKEFMVAGWDGPRIYFAPLVGAYQAIKAEMNRK